MSLVQNVEAAICQDEAFVFLRALLAERKHLLNSEYGRWLVVTHASVGLDDNRHQGASQRLNSGGD